MPPGAGLVSRITCRACGFYTDVANSAQRDLPEEAVRRITRQRGWDIGRDFAHATCPNCRGSRKKPKLVPAVEVKPHAVPPAALPAVTTLLAQWEDDPDLTFNIPAQDPAPMPETATVTQLRADQPRTMTRSDRQVIFSKLQDAYPKEDAGYTAGWTDDKVAKDLGVPKGWVALLRDENFGPATVGPSVEEQFAAYRRGMEAEMTVLRDRLAALQGSINAASKDAAEMASAVLTLSRRVAGKTS